MSKIITKNEKKISLYLEKKIENSLLIPNDINKLAEQDFAKKFNNILKIFAVLKLDYEIVIDNYTVNENIQINYTVYLTTKNIFIKNWFALEKDITKPFEEILFTM